ncbi:MAG: PAS domain S-box protein [Pseudomonadota bacterium]
MATPPTPLSLVDSLDSLPFGVFILRRDYVVLLWNRCLEQWTGLASQDLVGRDIRERFAHLGQARFAGRLEQVFQTGSPTIFSSQLHHYVIPVPRPEGSFRHQHTIVSALPDQRERGFHALFAIQDVTDLTELAILHRQARDQAYSEVAARQDTEEALRRAKEESERILRVVPAAIFTVDAHKRILSWNTRAEELTGYSAQEVVGSPCSEFALTPCLFKCGLLAEDVQKPIIGSECSIRRRDGQVRLLRKNVDVVRDAAGRVVGGIESFEDITEQRRAEQELLESEERYRVAIEASNDGVLLMRDDQVLYTNARMARMLGLPGPEQMMGRDITDFVHPKYREGVHDYSVQRQAGLEVPTHFEVIALRPSGETFPVEISAGLTTFQGQPVTLGFVRDITERKRAEEELRKLSRAVEHSLASVVITDRDGTIQYVNEKFCQLTGYSRDEALGQNPRLLNSGLMDPEVYRQMWRALTDTDEWRGELLNRKKNGELFWEHAAISAIKKDNGQTTHYVAVKEDISERKRAEEALVESNRRLAQTIALAEEMATQAQAANQAKSDFLASMSHEIRTPLNGVIGMTGLLLDTELSGEQRQFAEVARSSAEALLTLINDILDLSKIEAGRLDLEWVAFEPHRLVEDVLDISSGPAYAKDLDIWALFETDLPARVVGDPGRFRQVLFNLVGNAVKFTEHGEVAVRMSLDKRQGSRTWVRVEVRDTGIGISAEERSRLFAPFSQADASTTRRFGGTGLGLSISKRLVELMGGTIGLDSQPGQGSVFWFVLPWQEAEPDPREDQADLAALSGTRVFCVEKNAGTRASLASTLSGWGVVCQEVSSGGEALHDLRAAQAGPEPFRLAIIDLQLPDMDGLELARMMRQDPLLQDLPLVGLSSLVAFSLAQEQLGACFNMVLNKPLRRDSLRASLLSLLAPAALGEASSRAAAPAGRPPRRARILLAEDNPVNQQLAVHLLTKMGHRVDLAGNGREAVAMAAKFTYDLIFMDAQMPEMDGFTATREIRSQPDPAGRVPIIAMTAYAMAGDRERCLAAGMDDYLAKPINLRELTAALQRQLDRASSDPLAPAPSAPPAEELPCLDLEDLLNRVEGDRDILRELVQMFMRGAPQRLASLEATVVAGDFAAAILEAHSLKGELANMSAKAASGLAKEVELAAKAQDAARLGRAWRDLHHEFQRFLEALLAVGLADTDSDGGIDKHE